MDLVIEDPFLKTHRSAVMHAATHDDQIALHSIQFGDSRETAPRLEAKPLEQAQAGVVVTEDEPKQRPNPNVWGMGDGLAQEV